MAHRFESLFDPFADADGPPPDRLGPFVRWLLRGTEPVIGVLLVVSLALGLAEAVAAWLVGWLIDQVADAGSGGFMASHALALTGILLFFLAARPVLMIISSGLVSVSLTPGIFHLAIWRLHSHTLGQALGFFESDFAGRISQKEMQTSNEMASATTEFLNAVAYGLAAILGALIVLAAAGPWLIGGLLLWFGAYLVIVVRYLPRIRVLSRARAEARAGLSGQLVDSISHMATVKLFAHAGMERAAARGALDRWRDAALAFGRTVWAFRAWLSILGGLLPAGLIGMAIWLWDTGATGPGTIAMAALISTRLAQMSGWVSFTAMSIFASVGTIEDGMRTLAVEHAIPDGPDAVPLERATGAVRFETVTFRYGRPEGGGLDSLSIDIRAGEKVGLVGPSGAGKSTAIALLARLHDVETGRITLDDRDIREIEQDSLRRQIAMVTQEAAMFNRSALANVLYGRPEAGEDAAYEAARRAVADDFIRDLRDPQGREGYAAHLGERGVRLSGGQRQRIALARAILKDAPVLVLDEATSALDSEVEAEIQAALDDLMTGKTVIAIAHRLSTIRRMDRIVVMDGGRVVESGPHDALIAEGGLYARLWQRQTGGFIANAAAE